MGAYMYPIKIRKNHQRVDFQEHATIESNTSLTLSMLSFVGDAKFDVEPTEFGGYDITVYRSRLETDEERDVRVYREESYMAEYRARHPKLEETT